MALHSIELCAGVGMLGEGLRAGLEFLGVDHRTVCYVEREAPAAAQLVALMEAGALDAAPVWSDLLTFRGEHWRGKVDCITAGFPCQDISIAGRRAGLDGKRSGLFFDILDIADACGAWCLALENVSAIATATASVVDEAEGELEERAAARVVGELADRGWDAEWITLSASDVGASHGRARWFCFAWRRGVADPSRHGRDRQHGEAGSGRGVCEAGNPVAHAERAERGQIGACGTGCIEGHDGRGRQAHRGAGVADEALAGRPAGVGLAHATEHGRNEGRAEPGREQGRPDAAECGCAVADAQHIRRGECRDSGSVHRSETEDAGDSECHHGSEPESSAVADPDERRGWSEQQPCRPGQRRGEHQGSGAGLADTSQPRLPDTEQRIAGSAGGGA